MPLGWASKTHSALGEIAGEIYILRLRSIPGLDKAFALIYGVYSCVPRVGITPLVRGTDASVPASYRPRTLVVGPADVCGVRLPLLGGHEPAKYTLGVFLRVLMNPLRGLGVA